MKTKLLSFVFFTLILTGLGAQAVQDRQNNDEVIVYRLPEPRQVFILRGDNNVVYKAAIPAASIVNNSFILPDNVRTESLAVYQEGKRVYTYTTFTADVVVVLRRGEMPRQVRVVQVHVPELKAGVPLEVVYGVRDSGLTWDFILDLEVTDGGNLNSALIAQIVAASSLPETTRLILAREPEIILTAASNALLEDSSVYISLGKLLLEAGKRQLIKVEEGTAKYNIIYRWDANRSERPAAFLRAQNPLKTMANLVRFTLNSGGIFISGEGSRMISISPDRSFDFQIGEQPNITTHKSLVTAEFPNRENLPFTHSFEYQVENKSSRAIDLEIEIPVAIGNRHRTEYHFTKEPDERPGGSMLWRYSVPPNQKIELKFSYDADLRNDPSYNRFNYYEGGR